MVVNFEVNTVCEELGGRILSSINDKHLKVDFLFFFISCNRCTEIDDDICYCNNCFQFSKVH